MWRSNVLRLRKCSSAGQWRPGVYVRWYSSEKSLSISEEEFEDALEKVLPRTWKLRKSNNETAPSIGFAISGGVDSMVLASLYSRARKANASLPQAHGFIVDHKVRPESTEEAAWVAEQVHSKFGMPASILTLTWPKDFDMSDTKRFETEARTLRYQALGRACRDRQIETLMVAHHGDDQAETVLMRLANNRLRTGLKGMQSIEWIPECEGIYGVHHSGKSQRGLGQDLLPFPVEQGGIQILRPLLAMEKSRLITTCKEHGVHWAEDKSNQIKTLTSRNSIRHIYTAHRLPEALSVSSLVKASLRMQERVSAHQAHANRLYDQCLMKLDIQTGSLLIRFPPLGSLIGRPLKTDFDRNEARNNAYCLIEKVANLVTPKFKPTIGQLAAGVNNIYPDLLTHREKEDMAAAGESHSKDNFTVYHIWWRRWNKSSPFEDHILPSEDYSSTRPHANEWLLTRQALEHGEAKNIQIPVPPSPTSLGAGPSDSQEQYQLFDGRFWIRLSNHTQDVLVIRPFKLADMCHLPTAQSRKQAMRLHPSFTSERFITAALSLIKPADIRFTLPAVFRRDHATGGETLVGFPTLNVHMGGLGPPEGVCDWHVRYKKVDLGQHTLRDLIGPRSKAKSIPRQSKAQHRGAPNSNVRRTLHTSDA